MAILPVARLALGPGRAWATETPQPAHPLLYSPCLYQLCLFTDYLPVLWRLLYTPTPQKPAASCGGFAGREKLSARNVEQHQSTETEHTAGWEALGPSPWTEALALPFFLLFPLCLAILWACFLGVSNLQWSWQLLSLLSALSEIQEQSSDLAALTFQKAISYQGNKMTQLLEVTASSVIREQLKQEFCSPEYCPGRPGERFFLLGEGTASVF